MRFAPISIVFLLFAKIAVAQFQVKPATNIAVNYSNGMAMGNPWTGGLNSAQLSVFDADGDGLSDDLFIFDRSGFRVLIFTGSMVGGERVYTHRPHLSMNFPPLRHWALMRDFNCDGKQDIVTQSPLGGGFAVYENVGETAEDLDFEMSNQLMLSWYIFNNNQFNTNIYTSALDIPAVIDADGDGDLDIFTFSVTGTQMEYHENMSIDSTGSCGSAPFRAANLCYGQFKEGSESNEVTLGQTCFNVINPRDGGSENLRHVGTTILAHDLNDDGIIDLVLGGVTYPNATFLENSVGQNGRDSITAYQTDFPAGFGGPAIHMDNFISTFYEDVTGDGIKDLIAGVNEPFSARNTESLWLYHNLGTDSAPVFSLVATDFLQSTTIDLGEVAAPTFADVNGDGLADMIVGSRGEFTGGSSFKPSLALFLNTGTSGSPEFTLADSDWLQVSEIGLGQYVHPTFGDIDGDGDLDLVIGDLSGRVFLFLNTAGAGNEMTFELGGAISTNTGVIDVGQQATPQLYDLDNDGKPDLIIGERNGNLNYYRNVSTSGSIGFEFITDTLGDISTVETGFFIGSSAPHFYKYNDITYLLIGVERGRLHLYSGIDGNENGTYMQESLNAFGVEAGEKARPAVIDLYNTGTPDIFCGSVGGGVLYYTSDMTVSVHNTRKVEKLQLYPNPASDYLQISGSQTVSNSQYSIYDISGRVIQSGVYNGNAISVSGIPSGAYILVLESDNLKEHGLWIKD